MVTLTQFIADHAGIIGLLFFVSAFTAIACWAFNPRSKHDIESHKYIPLSEDNHDLTT